MTELDWIPLETFCAMQKLSERKVKSIVREHAIPVLKAGSRYFFDGTAVQAFTEAIRLHKPPAAPGSRRKELDAALKATRPRRARRAA